MKLRLTHIAQISVVALISLLWTACSFAQDALPSWNDTAAKKNIVTFVERVTKQGSPDFVPPAERIATFDNDGTLWAEQPIYFQLAFALDRVKMLAPLHPEWTEKEPFASLLKGDLKSALAGGEAAIFEIVTATHSGMTTYEFDNIVRDWITTAKHPETGKLYTKMVYLLEWAKDGGGVRFALLVHHTDAEREWAYDRTSSIGRLDKALDAAQAEGWTVVDMKNDWKTIFPFGSK
jgi:hypothetical protein